MAREGRGTAVSAQLRRPHWEQKPAQVMAKEHVTLYGLPIVKDRSVPYARYDQAMCRSVFITHALVRHEYATKGAFMEHNRRLRDEVQRLRDKARRSDMLADEYELSLFFDKRIPDSVFSGKTFEAWRTEAEARDPSILHLSLADILLDEADELSPDHYPDRLVVRGATLPLAYKFDPGEDDDGITVTVPLALLPQLDPAVMAWTIPGWHEAKLAALLESLPKALRKTLAPLDALAVELASQLRPFDGALLPALERAIFERTGERVPRDAWDLRALPHYLGLHVLASSTSATRCSATAAISSSSSARSASARRSYGPRRRASGTSAPASRPGSSTRFRPRSRSRSAVARPSLIPPSSTRKRPSTYACSRRRTPPRSQRAMASVACSCSSSAPRSRSSRDSCPDRSHKGRSSLQAGP